MTRLEVYSTSKGDITQHQGSFGLVVRSYDTINWLYSSMRGVSWLACGVYDTINGVYSTMGGVS